MNEITGAWQPTVFDEAPPSCPPRHAIIGLTTARSTVGGRLETKHHRTTKTLLPAGIGKPIGRLAGRAIGLGLAIWLIVLSSKMPAADSALPLAQSFRSGALAYFEVRRLDHVVQKIQDSGWLARLESMPQYQEALNSQQYKQLQAVQQIVTAQLDMDLGELNEVLLGNRFAVALYAAEGKQQPDVLALAQFRDPADLQHLRARLNPFIVLAGDSVVSSKGAGDASILAIADQIFVATRDDFLIVASNRDFMEDALQPSKRELPHRLTNDVNFRDLREVFAGNHLIAGFLNLAALNQERGGRVAPQKLDNPLASLLFGGILELMGSSGSMSVAVDVDESSVRLSGVIPTDPISLGELYACYFAEPNRADGPQILNPAGKIGGFSLYRDFAAWYRSREELLQEQLLPQFDKFESGLGNLLPGKNFGEDVLPLLGRNLTFLSAMQSYGHLDGKPGIKLPGFALVVDLAKPDEANDVFQLFFQTFAALLNIQAGQQGYQPWLMTTETYHDVQISYGKYLKKPTGERLPIVFNFVPSAAWLGDKMIISSSLDLCKNLVDSLREGGSSSERSKSNASLEILAEPLEAILNTNRKALLAQAIQQGRTVQQAQAQVDGLLGILREFEGIRFATDVAPDAFRATAEVTWK